MSLNDTHSSTSYHFDHTGRLKSKSYSPPEHRCRQPQSEPVSDRSRYHTDFDENRPSENLDNTLSLVAKKDILNGTKNVNKPVDNTDAPTFKLNNELLEEIHKQDAAKYISGGIVDVIEKENNSENSCTSPPQRFIEQITRDTRKELQELSDRKLITRGGESS